MWMTIISFIGGPVIKGFDRRLQGQACGRQHLGKDRERTALPR